MTNPICAANAATGCFSALQRAENSSIPHRSGVAQTSRRCFSALQRAENSSMLQYQSHVIRQRRVSVLFSEPKIPQFGNEITTIAQFACFSALQRAENSSIKHTQRRRSRHRSFQCSSASRKFLNPHQQRSASADRVVSVLFSEPKIPQ